MSGKVSHGRGGVANIGPESEAVAYTDGEIVREGSVGNQGDGPYSAGRGGVGNIDTDGEVSSKTPNDAEIIPQTAVRLDKQESHHVGRGGAGNEAHVHKNNDKEHEGLGDKLKNIFHKDK
ncbi:hypothetical protein PV11_01105 [Exophiala sideris]|uniref:Uncharacterized protein n=1 Tax=Exophiala sideris TaxID=1016849 RepID=A0A0D1ZF75_9EURO|nr:hypothetical protein PV11_01105 [Exophiala sideris]